LCSFRWILATSKGQQELWAYNRLRVQLLGLLQAGQPGLQSLQLPKYESFRRPCSRHRQTQGSRGEQAGDQKEQHHLICQIHKRVRRRNCRRRKWKGKEKGDRLMRGKRLIPRELSAPSTSNKINVEKKATSSIGGGGSKKGGQQEEQQQQQQQQRQVQVCSLCIAEELPASLADTFIVICQNVVI